jgi:plastocyanin
MMQTRRSALIGAMLSVILVGSGGFPAAWAGDASVNIDNFTFTPAQITVAAGTKVTWSNRDDIPHTVTDASNPRAFKSPPLDTGDAFSHVFSTPGTYRYFCSLHPHMQGVVLVK